MQPIKLWKETPMMQDYGQPEPTLTPYLLADGAMHGAVIVCPGGAYCMKADHEGAPIAQRLNELGFHAFVLDYRVAPYRHPVPLMDVQRAVRLVRSRADSMAIYRDKIAVLGFSAGGHLVCSAATMWDRGNPGADDPVERESCRPDAFVACYPVVTQHLFWHEGSAHNLMGETLDLRQQRQLSLDNRVNDETPPAFIWHTAEDGAVPVENSLRLCRALTAHNVPVSLHVFPFGPHGVGLGREDSPLAEDWPQLLADFLRSMGF